MMWMMALALQAATVAPPHCPLDARYDPDNPFAQILAGKAPASIVAETPDMIALIPIAWERPGHVLVIPRRAVRNLDDMTATEMADALLLARRIAAAQRRAFGNSGYIIQQNNGGGAQHVCHVHFHVIPNTPVEKVEHATPAQMQAIAQRIVGALKADAALPEH
ncbi:MULTISPECIES: HIT family protein [Sphingomonas]|uniref:HIT family protein n=1 Tax=Sphingomonas adhaesiva TaxID=28212 RepID=A0A2A4IDU6_9SPHN|nr:MULTISPECIES: HIT family protein [Sphingomonas]PCG16000.1 HIT family protein [Sphingomonas adhaesiva]PZU74052.1 MAG: HIT family protein [Sphingomonas sp.]